MLPLTKLVIVGGGMALGLIGAGVVAAIDRDRMKTRNRRVQSFKIKTPLRPVSRKPLRSY